VKCVCDEDGKFDFDLIEPLRGVRYLLGEKQQWLRMQDEMIARIRARRAEIAANRRVPCTCEANFRLLSTGTRERPAS